MGAASSSSTRDRPTKQYRCDICGKTFDSMDIRNSHKTMMNQEQAIFLQG